MLKAIFDSFNLKGIIAVIISCILIVFLTVLSYSVSNENHGNKQLIYTKNNIIYRQGSSTPLTGTVIDTINKKIIRYDVVDGLKNGDFKIKLINGQVEVEGHIKNNKNEGKWSYFYPNGKLESEGYFNNDVAVDKWIWYFMNGKIKQEGYYKNGLKEGGWSFYDASGTIQAKIYFHDDKIVDRIDYSKIKTI